MKRNLTLGLLLLNMTLWAASHHPQAFLEGIAGQTEEGKAIYQHFCANCHAAHPLIPLGAPRKGYPEDWTVRCKQGKKRLFEHLAEGFNAMPARGGCFECTDVQLRKAIEYLLDDLTRDCQG